MYDGTLTASKFDTALRNGRGESNDSLLPDQVAAAAAAALGVGGASLTLGMAELRIPLGASDANAALAESVQFTEGNGPCLDALTTGEALDAPADELHRRWPRLAARWFAETPYRSAVSAPIPLGSAGAALNLYLTHERGGVSIDAQTIGHVAELAGSHLRSDFADRGDTSSISRRAAVWIAIGLLVGHHSLPSHEALASLRACALDRGVLLDELARSLVTGRTDVADIPIR